MVLAVLLVVGLCFGSFINALVYRLYMQSRGNKKLSILNGRSLCPHCKHELAATDLVPLASWLALRGRCRYCKKPISWQYPLVEALAAGLFILSYYLWPSNLLFGHARLFSGAVWQADALFILWLAILTGLVALTIYDLKWMLLPNRIVYPLSLLALVWTAVNVSAASKPLAALGNEALALAVGGGIFYLLFLFSDGRWIGGGDVKLGWVLGLLAATPGRALLFIFIGSLLGSLVSLPMVAMHRLKRSSTIPFGPFLIMGGIITVLFGERILHWYLHLFLLS